MAHVPDSTASIRRAGLDDAAALARLRWVWRTTERAEFGLSQPDFEVAFREWWVRRESGHGAYIAEVDGTAIGMAWLAVFERIPQPRQLERLAGNVQSVFVLEDFRNRGVGQALVEAAIAEASARGLGYLIVHPSERAFPLYRRLGFTETGQMLHLDLDRSRTTEFEEPAGVR
jgi:GNAT superfamily N-acetyltransferase